MSGDGDPPRGEDRTVLVDASVFITLAEIGAVELLAEIRGTVILPNAVADELTDPPAATWVATDTTPDWIRVQAELPVEATTRAASHLGRESPVDRADGPDDAAEDVDGDIALLALALAGPDAVVVVTDDKPLRKTCKALSIPVSGSIGVLVVAVENGTLTPDDAKEHLVAMDEVGARLGAGLLRRAERLIEDAAADPERDGPRD